MTLMQLGYEYITNCKWRATARMQFYAWFAMVRQEGTSSRQLGSRHIQDNIAYLFFMCIVWFVTRYLFICFRGGGGLCVLSRITFYFSANHITQKTFYIVKDELASIQNIYKCILISRWSKFFVNFLKWIFFLMSSTDWWSITLHL
jgi:hypothetical protein